MVLHPRASANVSENKHYNMSRTRLLDDSQGRGSTRLRVERRGWRAGGPIFRDGRPSAHVSRFFSLFLVLCSLALVLLYVHAASTTYNTYTMAMKADKARVLGARGAPPPVVFVVRRKILFM